MFARACCALFSLEKTFTSRDSHTAIIHDTGVDKCCIQDLTHVIWRSSLLETIPFRHFSKAMLFRRLGTHDTCAVMCIMSDSLTEFLARDKGRAKCILALRRCTVDMHHMTDCGPYSMIHLSRFPKHMYTWYQVRSIIHGRTNRVHTKIRQSTRDCCPYSHDSLVSIFHKTHKYRVHEQYGRHTA